MCELPLHVLLHAAHKPCQLLLLLLLLQQLKLCCNRIHTHHVPERVPR